MGNSRLNCQLCGKFSTRSFKALYAHTQKCVIARRKRELLERRQQPRRRLP
jgi:hypothetical protein